MSRRGSAVAGEGTGKRRAWRSAAPRLSRFALEHLLLLPLGAAIALVWSNTNPESYFRFSFAIAPAVNDVAMAFFFALMTKEVVEATADGGVLHPWRRALLPVIASLGITIVPPLLHVFLADPFGEPMLEVGWPVTLATDVAVSYFAVRLAFGARHAAIPFAILLAITADAIGFVVLALVHPVREAHLPGGIALFAAAMAAALGLRRIRTTSFWPYLLGPGTLSWAGLYWSGIHPALALVPVMPFLPHAARDPGFFVDASPEDHDTLSRFEIVWRYPAQVALLFFGLVNAGVPFGALEEGTWVLPIAVLVGKPIGLLLGAWLAVLIGLHLPHRLGWGSLVAIGFAAAIGFSVGLFFTAAVIPPGQLRSEINMGVLLTAVIGLPLAVVVGRLSAVARKHSH
jgi:NhaA family Na+:H+ antiporter